MNQHTMPTSYVPMHTPRLTRVSPSMYYSDDTRVTHRQGRNTREATMNRDLPMVTESLLRLCSGGLSVGMFGLTRVRLALVVPAFAQW